MLAFFSSLGDILVLIGSLVVNMFKSIIMLFTGIIKAVAFIYTAVGFLPSFVLSFVLLSISICIIVTVLNMGKQ